MIAALFPTIVGDENPNVAKAQRCSTSALGVAPLSGGRPAAPLGHPHGHEAGDAGRSLQRPERSAAGRRPAAARAPTSRVGARK